MLLYGVGRTSFTPQIRRHSSAGQSARFTSVRSWVQVPLSPPRRSKVRFAPASFLPAAEKKPSARSLAPPFPQKGTLGSPARLQAPSRRLTLAATLLRVLRSKLTDYPKRAPKGAFFFWCKGRASLLRSMCGICRVCQRQTRCLPKANSLACRSFAPAMLRQVERRSWRKVSVTVPSLASSGPG